MEKFILYYRVSTKKQGKSGLGLDAQKTIMFNYLKKFSEKEIVGQFQDIESGKNDKRPELLAAIEVAKQEDARLLIATLDRLSRNLSFIAMLMDNQIKFTACDIPEANELTIHIFAALAQYERKRIAERTKNAIAEKIKRGEKMGDSSNFSNYGRHLGGLEQRKIAQDNEQNIKAYQTVKAAERQTLGITLIQLAKFLNDIPLRTRTGAKWSPRSVKNLKRLYENHNKSEAA